MRFEATQLNRVCRTAFVVRGDLRRWHAAAIISEMERETAGALRESRRITRTRIGVIFGALAMHIVPMTALVVAQERPRPTAEFAVGWVGFADDGIVSESLVGAAGRWYLRPRISVGPEVVYIGSDNHSHLMVTGNVTWDLLAPIDGRPPPIAPFLVVGGGVFQTRETFFSGTFTSNEGAFTAGGGVRAAIGDRITIGVDTRVGWELHLRISGLVGLRLGR
jgi:hypothetical protein